MPETPRAQDMLAFAREAVGARVARLHKLEALVRAQDVDGVHDMRVASRRLRACLRLFRPCLSPTLARPLAEGARDITRLLGRPRALDVMIAAVRLEQERVAGPWRAALDVAGTALEERRAAVAGGCAEAVARTEGLQDLPEDMAWIGEETGEALEAFASKALLRGLARLWKAHRGWRRAEHHDKLHALRVAFKKYRYACEVFVPLTPALEGLVEDLKAVQESLGDWNDIRVLVHQLEELALEAPSRDAQSLVKLAFAHRAEEHLAAFRIEAEAFFSKDNRKRIEGLLSNLAPQQEIT